MNAASSRATASARPDDRTHQDRRPARRRCRRRAAGAGRSRPRNERMGADKIECNACPVLCQISRRQDRRLRPLRQPRRRAGAGRSGACCCGARWPARRRAGALRRRAARRRPPPSSTGDLLPADEVFVTGVGSVDHLPRLQARALHRRVAGRRRRHGHRRHRRHLQLLQPEGEDRHRPLARPRAGQRALQGRGGRPRHARPNTARRCCRSAACTTSPAAARRKAASPSR